MCIKILKYRRTENDINWIDPSIMEIIFILYTGQIFNCPEVDFDTKFLDNFFTNGILE